MTRYGYPLWMLEIDIDTAVDNASRPWDARDDAGWEHQEREDE